ncbi:MAG: hypothetical protein MJ060_02920 [Clostridia bacterium]|nr:hypothetical protein [Clostridia bacterium]
MNSSKNLIGALLALWCYAQNTNLNLANNASILLILYALLTRNNTNNNVINNPMQPTFGMPINSGMMGAPIAPTSLMM